MRIISEFHDYYDTIQIYGMDNNVTYIRKDKEVFNDEILSFFHDKFNLIHKYIFENYDCISINFCGIILFCGKIYPYLNITQEPKYNSYYKQCKNFYFYNYDDVIKFIKKYETKQIKKYYKIRYKKYIMDIKEFFVINNINYDNIINFHFSLRSPIIHIKNKFFDRLEIIINEKLIDMDLQKIINPFDAFQELAMFIGGIMGGKSPPMIQLKDKDLISKHGFDKWSFRKMPENRK